MKTLNHASLLFALGLCLSAGAARAESEQVGSAVSNLTQRYAQLRQVPDDSVDTGGDLQVDCIDLVFQNWSKPYLEILDHATDIDPNQVGAPLKTFGEMWFDADEALAVAEYMRPGVKKVLTQVIEEVRAANNGPAALDPTKITLADVQDSLYYANLNICLEPEIISKSLPQLKAADPSAPVPPGLRRSKFATIVWVKTVDGGIRPEVQMPSSPSAAVRPVFFLDSLSPMTYGEYLRQHQGR